MAGVCCLHGIQPTADLHNRTTVAVVSSPKSLLGMGMFLPYYYLYCLVRGDVGQDLRERSSGEPKDKPRPLHVYGGVAVSY